MNESRMTLFIKDVVFSYGIQTQNYRHGVAIICIDFKLAGPEQKIDRANIHIIDEYIDAGCR